MRLATTARSDWPDSSGLENLRDMCGVIGMGRAEGAFADQLLRLVAENLLAGGRDIRDGTEIAIILEHHVGAVLGEKAVTHLAFREG